MTGLLQLRKDILYLYEKTDALADEVGGSSSGDFVRIISMRLGM